MKKLDNSTFEFAIREFEKLDKELADIGYPADSRCRAVVMRSILKTNQRMEAHVIPIDDCVMKFYPNILKCVEDGMNISDAIKKSGISTTEFYKFATPMQKQELYQAKKLHTKYGVGFWTRK